MKANQIFSLKTAFFMAAFLFLLLACNNDDDDPQVESKEYTIHEIGGSGISGVALFEKTDGGTRITVELDGTSDGDTHPMHIHQNSASEGGPIAISLTAVNGATGMSVTQVTETDSGDPITYEELIEYDGYINVHLSPTSLATIVAQGDIGQNAP